MLLFALFLLFNNAYCNKIFPIDHLENKTIVPCVMKVLEKYYNRRCGDLTYVDINYSGKEIITGIHESSLFSVISRETKQDTKSKVAPVGGYLIAARNAADVNDNISILQLEEKWTPSAKFFIIIKSFKESDLQEVFEKLLKLHINNVIIINEVNQAVYSYNSYENGACGRYFDRIISYGTCDKPTGTNFFPDKITDNIRNCTINIAVPHIPPFAYDPSKDCELNLNGNCFGIEQYAMRIISDMEKLHVNFKFVDFAQNYSKIYPNMTATGSFKLIQNNTVDGLVGFTVLTDIRAKAFDYVYGYSLNADEFIYVVKKSGFEPVWKSIFLEFNSTVWLLLVLSFIVCSAFAILLIRPKDKTATLLKMWDTLFLHGFSVHNKYRVKIFLVMWILFAYWINSFYQSSLMSLTTNPVKAYQTSTEEDLIKHSFKPCVTPALRDFLLTALADMPFDREVSNCPKLEGALRKVSNTPKMYTIAPHMMYTYKQPLYYDPEGESKLFGFPDPIIKVIYAIYFYKGFPMTERMHKRALALRESGLIMKFKQFILYRYKISHLPSHDKVNFKSRVIVPWTMLAIGLSTATIVFILEVLGKNN